MVFVCLLMCFLLVFIGHHTYGKIVQENSFTNLVLKTLSYFKKINLIFITIIIIVITTATRISGFLKNSLNF